MDNVKINTSKTLSITLPSDPDGNSVTVSVIHDLGNDTILSNAAATRQSAGVYNITLGQGASGIYKLNSSGVHAVKFTYTEAGIVYSQYQYINVYTPYTESEPFFEEYPELVDGFEDVFDKFELKARNIINTYCGQSFDYYPSKSMFIDGNNHKMLHLPLPISTVSKVTSNFGQEGAEVLHDASDSNLIKIEKVRQPGNFESSYYLRFKTNSAEFSTAWSGLSTVTESKFPSKNTYKIEGDFGWKYVPSNVTQAANLLIASLMNDDSEFRRHGIFDAKINSNTQFKFKSNFYESTGNIDADVLLMDYTMFIMDYII